MVSTYRLRNAGVDILVVGVGSSIRCGSVLWSALVLLPQCGIVGKGTFAGDAQARTLESLTPIKVSPTPPEGRVRVCLSYEKAHGDQDRTSAALEATGVATTPIRIDSQCKYAMVASGRADLYLRLAREGYQEKSWDHAAGCAVVRAAGGLVESATGEPLRIKGRWVDAPGGIVVRTNAVNVPAS